MNIRRLVVLALLVAVAPTFAASVDAVSAQVPVSLLDTVTSRDVDSVLMRPDGALIAYVVKQADLTTNKNIYTLRVVSSRGGDDRALLTADGLSDVMWGGDGRTLYGLAQRDARYIIVKADTETAKASDIFTSEEKINKFAVAPNGNVAFTTAPQADAETMRRRKEEGLVYAWGTDSVLNIVNRNYTQGDWEDFHLVDAGSKTSRLLYRLKYDGAGRHLAFVSEMVFSPDSGKLALSIIRRGSPEKGGPAFNYDVAVLDAVTAEWIEVAPDSILTDRNVAWSADSRRVLFFHDTGLWLYDLASRKVDTLPWATAPEKHVFASDLVYDSAKSLAYARTSRGAYTFDFKRQSVKATSQGGATVEAASFDKAYSSYAFVDQASERRPEVAIHESKTNTTRRLTNLNPWIDQRTFGKVEKLEVENASGVKVAAYLVYPVGFTAGRHYPFIIGTYGFVGKFILGAEWHTTFPAQALAGQGYAVLLLNVPPSGQSVANDPEKARDLEGWQMLSTFDRAVQMMVERGIADPDRMGIYGWSHGAFVVQFLQAHSKTRFKAAAMGEGGDYNPGEYASIGMTGWPQIFQNMYGGHLSARTAKAYLDFAPVLNVENFSAPMLMEFSGRDGDFGLEAYVPLRVRGVPAELVTYDDEPHNFVTPRARLASMARKVDWFNFWMLDREDQDAAKQEQFRRWRQLRADWVASRAAP
ncbi:MAG: prolyl oligopeptidase family serine peptidase [Gammaproteobacteria bacterium]